MPHDALFEDLRLHQLLPIHQHQRIPARRDHSLPPPLHNLILIRRHDVRQRFPVRDMLIDCPTESAGVVNGVVETLAAICVLVKSVHFTRGGGPSKRTD